MIVDNMSIIIPLFKLKWTFKVLLISLINIGSSNIEKSKYGRKEYSIKVILIPNNIWDNIKEKQRVKIEVQDTKTWLLYFVDKNNINEDKNIIGTLYLKYLMIYSLSKLFSNIVVTITIIRILIITNKIIVINLDKYIFHLLYGLVK